MSQYPFTHPLHMRGWGALGGATCGGVVWLLALLCGVEVAWSSVRWFALAGALLGLLYPKPFIVAALAFWSATIVICWGAWT